MQFVLCQSFSVSNTVRPALSGRSKKKRLRAAPKACAMTGMAEQAYGVAGLMAYFPLICCSVLFAIFTLPPASAVGASSNMAGNVFLFRGVAGFVFSRGMDQLAERLNRVGVAADVNAFVACNTVAETAIQMYRRNPSPIVLVGHSAGASCVLKFAEMLSTANIPVNLLVTLDPTRFDRLFDYKLPLNVERYINVYQSKNILGGRDVSVEQGFQGHYASFDLSDHREINHINIDKLETVYEQLVVKIQQLPTTPWRTQGNHVPIHFDVPADASIELWDSGMPVLARAGETLEALAATYKVPIWSLTQINQVPADAALAQGQRLVVPRHLIPLVARGRTTH